MSAPVHCPRSPRQPRPNRPSHKRGAHHAHMVPEIPIPRKRRPPANILKPRRPHPPSHQPRRRTPSPIRRTQHRGPQPQEKNIPRPAHRSQPAPASRRRPRRVIPRRYGRRAQNRPPDRLALPQRLKRPHNDPAPARMPDQPDMRVAMRRAVPPNNLTQPRRPLLMQPRVHQVRKRPHHRPPAVPAIHDHCPAPPAPQNAHRHGPRIQTRPLDPAEDHNQPAPPPSRCVPPLGGAHAGQQSEPGCQKAENRLEQRTGPRHQQPERPIHVGVTPARGTRPSACRLESLRR